MKGSAVASRTRSRKNAEHTVKNSGPETKKDPNKRKKGKRRRVSHEFSVLSSVMASLDDCYDKNKGTLDSIFSEEGEEHNMILLIEYCSFMFNTEVNAALMKTPYVDHPRLNGCFQNAAIFDAIKKSEGSGKALEQIMEIEGGLKDQVDTLSVHCPSASRHEWQKRLRNDGEELLCLYNMHICLGYILPSRDPAIVQELRPSKKTVTSFTAAIDRVFPEDEELTEEAILSNRGSTRVPILTRYYKRKLMNILTSETSIDVNKLMELVLTCDYDWGNYLKTLKVYMKQLQSFMFGQPELARILQDYKTPKNTRDIIPDDVQAVLKQHGHTNQDIREIEEEIDQNRKRITKLHHDEEIEVGLEAITPSPRKRKVEVMNTENTKMPRHEVTDTFTTSSNLQSSIDESKAGKDLSKKSISGGNSYPAKSRKMDSPKTLDSTKGEVGIASDDEQIKHPYPVTTCPVGVSINMTEIKGIEMDNPIDHLKLSTASLMEHLGAGVDPLKEAIESVKARKLVSKADSEGYQSCEDKCVYDDSDTDEDVQKPKYQKKNVPSKTESLNTDAANRNKMVIDKTIENNRNNVNVNPPRAVPDQTRTDGRKRQTRVKWSKEEETALRDGVRHFGVGNWTRIFTHFGDKFHACRTPVSLKDKWRNISR